MNEPWLGEKKILMLQPRRLAARGVATRMAHLLGESVGERVGYQIRLDTKRSARTRIEVITEGILTRRLLAEPELSDVGLIIFDEFHERSINADIGLALALETASVLRPDLKILIMSATLGESIPHHYLAGAWRYTFEGTTFPVSTVYAPGDRRLPIWEQVTTGIRRALQETEGDILAFLPGAYEISRTQELLEKTTRDAIVTPLYGELSYDEQERALYPDPRGRRKIVLSTTIAETSLTIEGIRAVVDSGLHKVARSDSQGSSSLSTEQITRDAADQRAGRAGRTAPGVCYRLWSEQEHLARRPYREPEILRTDLTSPLLDLALWGVTHPEKFSWITQPPPHAIASAQRTLRQLGAITQSGAVTPLGKALSTLGTHPRLGALALHSKAHALEETAARIIALLEERDILRGKDSGADIESRLHILERGGASAPKRMLELSARWLSRIQSAPRLMTTSQKIPEHSHVGFLIATAFPELIALRRGESSHRYLLAHGTGAELKPTDPLKKHELLAVASLQESREDATILLAAPLDRELFNGPLAHLMTTEESSTFDEVSGSLQSRRVTRSGALILSSHSLQNATSEDRARHLLTWLASPEAFSRLTWSDASHNLRTRALWARQRAPQSSIPDLSDDALRATVNDWLGPFLPASPSLSSITEKILSECLDHLLPYATRKELDTIAPPIFKLPTGRERPLSYSEKDPPSFEARIQDLFGLAETPLIGRLKIPAQVHLLSPAHRPVQVTQDLASFWKNGYPEVRKELRGRYPKHKWPEDPLKGD
jgi:ATP-dependent helicase HrpB